MWEHKDKVGRDGLGATKGEPYPKILLNFNKESPELPSTATLAVRSKYPGRFLNYETLLGGRKTILFNEWIGSPCSVNNTRTDNKEPSCDGLSNLAFKSKENVT